MCGVSTTFWGIMYGSFFGDMINTIASVFLNSSFTFDPVLLNPTDKPLELMIISVAFGMVHILTAMCIKFYMLWRKGNKTDAICDIGFWIIALLGISIFAAGMGLAEYADAQQDAGHGCHWIFPPKRSKSRKKPG